MIASLRIIALVLGVGVGALGATVLSLVFWLILALLGVDDAPLIGLTVAVLAGLALAGYASGRMAVVAHRFHGSVSGLGLAALVLVVARLGGSPAPTAQVLWLSALAILLGGLGGAVGGRRRAS